MRLDKYISQCTDYSRKEVQKLVSQKRIHIDGTPAQKASQSISDSQEVTLDGQVIKETGFIYLMMNKPKGVICATEDAHQPTVIDLIKEPWAKELHIAGRLDKDTTGLVLLTNDGQWSHRITSPRHNKDKVYLVTTADPIPQSAISLFAEGIKLKSDEKDTLPAKLRIIDEHHAYLSIQEGRYHQVKRMFGAIGNRVEELHRTQIAEIKLDSALAPGEYRHLTEMEISDIPVAQ